VAEDAGADEGGASGGERRFCEGEGRKKLLSGCVAPHLHRNLHVGAGGAWNNRSEFGGRPRGSYLATPDVCVLWEMQGFFRNPSVVEIDAVVEYFFRHVPLSRAGSNDFSCLCVVVLVPRTPTYA